MVSPRSFAAVAVFLMLASLTVAQPPSGNGRDGEEQLPVNAGSPLSDIRQNLTCDSTFRRFDGACTNNVSPPRKLFGSTRIAQFSYFGRSSSPIRQDVLSLPSPRLISNIVSRQTMDVRESRGLTDLVTFFGQFIDHTIAATPVNDGKLEQGRRLPTEPLFIDVPEDDPMLSNITGGKLRFFRSRRAIVEEGKPDVRPINTLTSLMDLDSVYGPSRERSIGLREMKDGRLKTGPGNLLPQNSMRLSNAPRLDRQFFIAGDLRCNEHPVLTAFHTIFLREHNDIAAELKEKFPEFTKDEELFETARQINIAQFQKIVFDEWYPAITGRNLPRWRKFEANVNPGISVLFSTAAFRVGHTLVNNQVTRQGPRNRPQKPLTLANTFFSNVNLILNVGIDSFLRGAANTRAQEIDLMVVDALRNFLFTNVNGEDGLDLIALNLQRGRDHGLPFYNDIRARFRRGNRASSFADITRNKNMQSALQTAYGSVDKVEAWIGLVAEDHAGGSSMGPTMLAIWVQEFRRMRDGDRFYYEDKTQYDPEVLANIPRLQDVFDGKDIMRSIILRNTDITESELPNRTFFAN